MVKLTLNLKENLEGKFIFYAGEKIQGCVNLILNRDTVCNALSVKIIGKSTLKECYLHEEIVLFTQRNVTTMSAGCYSYPFGLRLPYALPQSNDIINYHCEAFLDIPWNFNRKFCHDFLVRRRDDLNVFPILHMAGERRLEKIFYSYLCGSMKLLFEVLIPHSGIAAGQIVPIKIKYDNNTSIKVERTKIQLEEHTVIGNDLKISRKRILERDYCHGVERNDYNVFTHSLKIPHYIDPSDLLFSNSVKVKHYISVTAQVEGMHLNPKIYLPIVIGSISLDDDDLRQKLSVDDDSELVR